MQFLPGMDPNVSQERSCHLAEQGLYNIEPGAVRWGMNILEAVGPGGQKRPSFLGNMGGVIVEDQTDHRLRRILGIQILQQSDELAAAVTPFDAGRHMPRVKVQAGQDEARSHAPIFVVAPQRGVPSRNGR